MVKRVKVSDEPRIYSSMIHAGGCARDEGRAIDDVECALLRDPDMAASWREGWQGRDAERRRGAETVQKKRRGE